MSVDLNQAEPQPLDKPAARASDPTADGIAESIYAEAAQEPGDAADTTGEDDGICGAFDEAASGANADDEEIARLAALRPLEYDREREAAAVRLGVRPSALDAEVKKARGPASAGDFEQGPGAGRALDLRDPEPWPQRVDGAKLLDDLAATFRRFVILQAECEVALALWVGHAHSFEASPITPRLAITSPEKRCGKTTVLEIVQALSPRPVLASNITAAAVFRTIEAARPTLLIDEADTFLAESEQLRGVLNSGHRRTGEVIRTAGEDFEPRRFSTWSPVAIAAIGQIPGTLDDRSVRVELRRRGPGECVERWRADRADQLEDLGRQCARWAKDHVGRLRELDPEVPAQLHDRAADNWRPLLAIADLAGGEWPVRARAAAVTLSASGGSEGRREMLLADVRLIFSARAEPEWIATAEIVRALVAMDERPWPEASRGKPLTPSGLRSLLQPFKISSCRHGGRDDRARGYRRESFLDAWARYLLPVDQPRGVDPSTRPPPSNSAGFGSITTRPHPSAGGRVANGLESSISAPRGRVDGSAGEEELSRGTDNYAVGWSGTL